MKSILEGRPQLEAVINQIAEVTGYLWQKGWAERNGGNITVNVTAFVDDEMRALPPISEPRPIALSGSSASSAIGKTLPHLEFNEVRGFEGIKEATIDLNGFELKVCVAHTLGNARKVMDKLRAGELNYHVVEVMACPGGCIGGAGQPYHHGNIEILKARAAALYREDEGKALRKSHENPDIQKLYKEFLGEPCGEKSHHLLHTHYFDKSIH